MILNINVEDVDDGFGKVYWNQHLQGNFIRSLIRCLRFLIQTRVCGSCVTLNEIISLINYKGDLGSTE
jgi:hypothetical protein